MYLWYVDSLVHTFVILLIILEIIPECGTFGWVGFFLQQLLNFPIENPMTISTLVGLLLLIFTLKNPGRNNHGWVFLGSSANYRLQTILASGSIGESSRVFFHSRPWRFVPKGPTSLRVSEVRTDHTGLEIWIDIAFQGHPAVFKRPWLLLLDIGVVRNPIASCIGVISYKQIF